MLKKKVTKKSVKIEEPIVEEIVEEVVEEVVEVVEEPQMITEKTIFIEGQAYVEVTDRIKGITYLK